MRRTLFYWVTFILFTFVKVNANAQEIFDFNYFSFSGFQEENNAYHTISVAHTGSGGGAFSPSTSTRKFGIIYKEGGITPLDVNEELLNSVLQEQDATDNFVPSVNYTSISEKFQYYDYDSSTFQDFTFTGIINSDNEIVLDENMDNREYIFCWIINGRLWYCYITTAGLIPHEAYSIKEGSVTKIHCVFNFVFDAYTNPYGMNYYDGYIE